MSGQKGESTEDLGWLNRKMRAVTLVLLFFSFALYKVEAGAVWLDAPQGGKMTWLDGITLCESKAKRLCRVKQVCPGGAGSAPAANGKQSKDFWVPVAEIKNAWVQVGTHAGALCKRHSDISGGKRPVWGNKKDPHPFRGKVMCCDDHWVHAGHKGATWKECVDKCKAQGKHLCKRAEYCPQGIGHPPKHGIIRNSVWSAVGDKPGAFVAVGQPFPKSLQCKEFNEITGKLPKWGENHNPTPWRGWFQCCGGAAAGDKKSGDSSEESSEEGSEDGSKAGGDSGGEGASSGSSVPKPPNSMDADKESKPSAVEKSEQEKSEDSSRGEEEDKKADSLMHKDESGGGEPAPTAAPSEDKDAKQLEADADKASHDADAAAKEAAATPKPTPPPKTGKKHDQHAKETAKDMKAMKEQNDSLEARIKELRRKQRKSIVEILTHAYEHRNHIVHRTDKYTKRLLQKATTLAQEEALKHNPTEFLRKYPYMPPIKGSPEPADVGAGGRAEMVPKCKSEDKDPAANLLTDALAPNMKTEKSEEEQTFGEYDYKCTPAASS